MPEAAEADRAEAQRKALRRMKKPPPACAFDTGDGVYFTGDPLKKDDPGCTLPVFKGEPPLRIKLPQTPEQEKETRESAKRQDDERREFERRKRERDEAEKKKRRKPGGL